MLAQDQAGSEIDARRRWLSVLARAKVSDIRAQLAAAPALPEYNLLRGPEAGMTMLRGRMGGGGQSFNLGEMTLSRCSIQDQAGRVGHGYAAGRDLAQVELIARLDAVLQDEEAGAIYHKTVIEPLAAQQDAQNEAAEARAAGTEVKFFTLAAMRS